MLGPGEVALSGPGVALVVALEWSRRTGYHESVDVCGWGEGERFYAGKNEEEADLCTSNRRLGMCGPLLSEVDRERGLAEGRRQGVQFPRVLVHRMVLLLLERHISGTSFASLQDHKEVEVDVCGIAKHWLIIWILSLDCGTYVLRVLFLHRSQGRHRQFTRDMIRRRFARYDQCIGQVGRKGHVASSNSSKLTN